MISREDALKLIAAASVKPISETISLQDGVGRVLATPVTAQRTHPPQDMSSMDGYAVRYADCAPGKTLKLIGEASAGHPFTGSVGPGECVRCFTGSVIPTGADHVIIQEDVNRDGDHVEVVAPQAPKHNIRKAGIDFQTGQILMQAGTQLRPRHLSICAAANLAELTVHRQPRVGILTNGDELKPPGSVLQPGEIIASNEYSLLALIEAWGGRAVNLGIAPDQPNAIKSFVTENDAIDIFVPVGGASVGDHDHMQTVFADLGFEPTFSKVAVKPGKPTWMSTRTEQRVLGLPGNPASALVCAHLFLKPLIQNTLGMNASKASFQAKLTAPLGANGPRESFLRGRISYSSEGDMEVVPASDQDSSLLSPFVESDVLIHRAVNASALEIGDRVSCFPLD